MHGYPIKDWLSEEDADDLMVWLLQNEKWEQRHFFALGKECQQPRLMGWAGTSPTDTLVKPFHS